ncbi:MAG: DUF4115 domain-containing protein [Deltaproteobacteria bacterium]|nr:DUF4115 domain-containing protein [Deltaproteobacteria bacterium]
MNDLKELGGFLRNKREKLSLSLQDVSERLCLRCGIIEEIEAGTADQKIPAVYLSGYIKQYARLLQCEEEVVKIISELKRRNKNEESRETRKGTVGINLNPRRLFIYFLILAVFAGFWIVEKKMGEKKPSTRMETKIEESRVEATSVPEITSLLEKKLIITCHERTWISVVVDGKEKKEFMLNPKDVVVLNAKEGFDLLIGNAGGVRLVLNGKDLSFSGKSGEVKRLKLY